MKLNDKKIKALEPKEKPYTLSDGTVCFYQ